MTAVRYRPLGASDIEGIGTAVQEIARAWSVEWFGSELVRRRSFHWWPALKERDGDSMRGACVRWSCSQHRVLATLALGTAGFAGEATNCASILDELQAQAIDDLGARSLATFGGAAADRTLAPATRSRGEVHIDFDLPDTGARLLCRLDYLAVTAMLPAAKSPTRGPTLGSRLAGVGTARVQIDATFGSADIAIGDLQGLRRGDVVLLDRSLPDPVQIRVAGGGPLKVAAYPCRKADRIALEFTKILEDHEVSDAA